MAESARERAFLKLIRARPLDDAPRLMYADWLDERGDPRGEFIRVQCALASLPATDALRPELITREQRLLDEHEVEWARPVRDLVSGWEFRRGVLESVSLSAETFLHAGRELARLAPIRRFRLFDAEAIFPKLMESSALAVVQELDLCGNDLANGGVNLLSRSPHLRELEVLDLSFNGITDVGLEVIASATNLPGLRELYLNDNGPITARGTRALAESEWLHSLPRLDLSASGIDGNGLSPLLAGEWPGLQILNLQSNRLADDGATVLALSPLFERLVRQGRRVELSHCDIGEMGVRALASSKALAGAVALDLSQNLLGDDGVAALVASPYLEQLRELRLAENRIEIGGALELAEWDQLSRLTYLDLRGNQLTVEGIAAIRQSPKLNWRTTLDLPEATEWTPRSAQSLERVRSRRSRRRRSE